MQYAKVINLKPAKKHSPPSPIHLPPARGWGIWRAGRVMLSLPPLGGLVHGAAWRNCLIPGFGRAVIPRSVRRSYPSGSHTKGQGPNAGKTEASNAPACCLSGPGNDTENCLPRQVKWQCHSREVTVPQGFPPGRSHSVSQAKNTRLQQTLLPTCRGLINHLSTRGQSLGPPQKYISDL